MPRMKMMGRAVALALLTMGSMAAGAQTTADDPWPPPAWTEPVAPFRIVGNVYYVGTRGLAAYLIVSSKGAILLDGTLEQNAPAIERSIAALGFRLDSVRLLLNSHAHYDHAAGLAALKRDTGARLLASARDRAALEEGRHEPGNENGRTRFPAVKVDGVIRDGQTVRLGDVALKATLTPGHTAGCTTWSMPIGRLVVVFPCSLSVAGNSLDAGRIAGYRQSFARLSKMRADIVLPAHPELAEVMDRHARGTSESAFIDPEALPRLVAQASAGFERDLAAQRQRR